MKRRYPYPLVFRLRWALYDVMFFSLLLAGFLYLAFACLAAEPDKVRLSAAIGGGILLLYGVMQRVRAGRALGRARCAAKRIAQGVVIHFRVAPCLTCYDWRFEILRFVPAGRSVQFACASCERKRWAPAVSQGAADIAALYEDFAEHLQKYRRLRGKPEYVLPLMSATEPAPLPYEGTARTAIAADLRRHVFARDGGRCRQCGASTQLHFDHVVPVARGGATTEDNLQLLCAHCNQRKGSRV